MIDRKARNRLGELGRQLASGVISTGQFEADLPFPTGDESVEMIWWEVFDCLYCDIWPFWSHQLRGRRAVGREVKAVVARADLFLHSDLAFCAQPLPERLEGSIWPFATVADFERAKRSPRFLSGRLQG